MDRSKALSWTELRVGLVVIVSLVVLSFTILYMGSGAGAPWSPRFDVRALMRDVNGLKPGAPVRLGGVEVGSVTHLDFAPGAGGLVEVTMRLDRRIQERVTTSSQAALGSLGLLGEKAVDLTSDPGGTPIEDGGFLPGAQEDPFKGLLSDASDSTAHLRRILSRLDAGEGLVGKALRDDELYERMTDVSQRLQGVMAKLESPTGPLGRLVNDAEMSRQLAASVRSIQSAAGRIEAGEGALGALSRDAELERDLKQLTDGLSEVARALQQGDGTAGKLIRDGSLHDKLDGVATRLDALLSRLEAGQGTAGRLVHDAELYDNLSAAARDMRALVADVRRDPAKYLRVKLSLF
jgi:phospholipid/cholesterol/gamma-HCH transport system substrate-binding protein